MSPDSFGKRPGISILDATKGASGAVYFMGTASAPVGYVDTKQGLVKDPSKIFVWGTFRGNTKVKFITDFEAGGSALDNQQMFLDIVKTYDSAIRSD